jgi:hypothetical protein
MNHATTAVPFAFLVYPMLWNRARELHPPGAGYVWEDHLRDLCRVCREYWNARNNPDRIPWSLVPEAERMCVESLATVDVGVFILDIVRHQTSRPDDRVKRHGELYWLDPSDPHLSPEPARPARSAGDRSPEAYI